ncbi:DUF4148 domain-containing protein [Caballeronia sp. DA-9]|uniref:DUF4148 domain-containing protein n=1 Tax=Caballeronia sp. DA-9 TaxID=3436237 RepID=UPI003F6743FC
MKSILLNAAVAAAVAAVLAIPVLSYAQSNEQSEPLTRAQVRQEFVELEQAGYEPADRIHYPENLQTAEARVAARKEANGYGPTSGGSSQSGR